MFIDTHCHLSFDSLYNDLPNVLLRAKNAGVGKIFTMGNNLKDSLLSQKVSSENSEVYFTAGIHPEDCTDFTTEKLHEDLSAIIKLFADPKCIGIGEAGLDIRWAKSLGNAAFDNEVAKQVSIFKSQLDLALEHNLPIVIHCREGEDEMFDDLEVFVKNGGRGILHSFTGDVDFMKYFLDLGMYVSFNGIITFKNGQNVRDLLSEVSLDKILFETDAPFLAPEPYRGQTCEPWHVVETYKKASVLKNVDVEKLQSIVEENVDRLFNIG